MKKIDPELLMPKMMGTEIELSFSYKPREENSKEKATKNSAPDYDAKLFQLAKYLLDAVHVDDNTITTSNGSVFMQICSDRPLEIATPECNNPKELVAYTEAARTIIRQCSKEFLNEYQDNIRSISIHDRVIDSNETTWGVHDNYSKLPHEADYGLEIDKTPSMLLIHLLTRSSISGSGWVNQESINNGSWMMSQKTPSIKKLIYKSWSSSAMSGDDDRLEVRCSDNNLSEWAQVMRLGSMALVLALVRTGYTHEMIGIDDSFLNLYEVGSYDELLVNKDGEVKLTKAAKRGLMVQRRLAEASCHLLDIYEDFDPGYKKIARDWLEFTERLTDESDNGSIDLLNYMETDWASKFYIIQKKIKNSEDPRTPYDFKSLQTDLLYDRTMFDAPMIDGKIFCIESIADQINKKYPRRRILDNSIRKQALSDIPKGGQAELRHKKINDILDNNGLISDIEWRAITWTDEDDNEHITKF